MLYCDVRYNSRCLAKEITAEQPMSVLKETLGEDLDHLHANVSVCSTERETERERGGRERES